MSACAQLTKEPSRLSSFSKGIRQARKVQLKDHTCVTVTTTRTPQRSERGQGWAATHHPSSLSAR